MTPDKLDRDARLWAAVLRAMDARNLAPWHAKPAKFRAYARALKAWRESGKRGGCR